MESEDSRWHALCVLLVVSARMLWSFLRELKTGMVTPRVLGASNKPCPKSRKATKQNKLVNDKFGESGKPHELLIKYGLDAKNIFKSVKKVIHRK